MTKFVINLCIITICKNYIHQEVQMVPKSAVKTTHRVPVASKMESGDENLLRNYFMVPNNIPRMFQGLLPPAEDDEDGEQDDEDGEQELVPPAEDDGDEDDGDEDDEDEDDGDGDGGPGDGDP